MKRTNDPILSNIRRAHAISEKRAREVKPPRPISDAPSEIPGPPEIPPAPTDAESVETPVPDKPVILRDIKATGSIDTPTETGEIIVTEKPITVIDWLLRR